ncbi:MAG: hypothetical protein Q9175_002098 [Cornicularia normoerica]
MRTLCKPGIQDIRVATTESWQDKKADLVVVDPVRAKNDHGSLGFFRKKERLNLLLTRHTQHLFVVGDPTCCETDFAAANLPVEASEPTTANNTLTVATSNSRDRRNVWMVKVLRWFQEHGRDSSVAMDTLIEAYITVPTREGQQEGVGLGV